MHESEKTKFVRALSLLRASYPVGLMFNDLTYIAYWVVLSRFNAEDVLLAISKAAFLYPNGMPSAGQLATVIGMIRRNRPTIRPKADEACFTESKTPALGPKGAAMKEWVQSLSCRLQQTRDCWPENG